MNTRLLLFFILIGVNIFSQDNLLKNKSLIKYYSIINAAEKKIIENDFKVASKLYKQAFSYSKHPSAKDIYNNMIVSIKVGDSENTNKNFVTLKCLGYKIKDSTVSKFLSKSLYRGNKKCKNSINNNLKINLDSLFNLDQYYRKISNGDYKSLQKEITKSDSIASIQLFSLIKKYGFPNEYDIGLESANNHFFQNFYYIIWHQMSNNLYSSQKINFTNEIVSALNKGKIIPENAAFLLDILNGTQNYASSSLYFSIQAFAINGKNEDCCYVHEWFFPDKRDEKANKIIKQIDTNRKSIGLNSFDDYLKIESFYLKNSEFIFPRVNILVHDFKEEKNAENIKKFLIKIK